MTDIVSRISTVTASDILAEILEHDRIEGEPDLFTAIQKADEYKKRFGLYVRPEFLLDKILEFKINLRQNKVIGK